MKSLKNISKSMVIFNMQCIVNENKLSLIEQMVGVLTKHKNVSFTTCGFKIKN